MDTEAEVQARAFREFARNIARLNAHGDQLKDGTEVVWDDHCAQAQLSEIIGSAQLLAGTLPEQYESFHSPHRRAKPHPDCVRTYPDAAFGDEKVVG